MSSETDDLRQKLRDTEAAKQFLLEQLLIKTGELAERESRISRAIGLCEDSHVRGAGMSAEKLEYVLNRVLRGSNE